MNTEDSIKHLLNEGYAVEHACTMIYHANGPFMTVDDPDVWVVSSDYGNPENNESNEANEYKEFFNIDEAIKFFVQATKGS